MDPQQTNQGPKRFLTHTICIDFTFSTSAHYYQSLFKWSRVTNGVLAALAPERYIGLSDYGILWDKLIFTRFFTLLSILAINKKIRLRALLHNNFPYITDMIAKVKNATGDTFLPREVSQVFLSMMSLMDDFQALSYERAVKRTKPHVNYKPCERLHCTSARWKSSSDSWSSPAKTAGSGEGKEKILYLWQRLRSS